MANLLKVRVSAPDSVSSIFSPADFPSVSPNGNISSRPRNISRSPPESGSLFSSAISAVTALMPVCGVDACADLPELYSVISPFSAASALITAPVEFARTAVRTSSYETPCSTAAALSGTAFGMLPPSNERTTPGSYFPRISARIIPFSMFITGKLPSGVNTIGGSSWVLR